MTNHNSPSTRHNRVHLPKPVVAAAALGLTALTLLLGSGNARQGGERTVGQHHGALTTSQLDGEFRYQGLPIVSPTNSNYVLELVGNTNAKAGDAVALSQDGGQTWDVVPEAPLDDFAQGSFAIDASFAPETPRMNGNQVFEVTYVADKGAEVAVQMDEVTSTGDIVRVDTDAGAINFDNPHGQWSQDTAGEPVYTLQSMKGGGDMPTQLQVTAPNGK